MRLLLDQGLPRSTITHLAAVGIVANHVGDLGMARASDAEILEAARQRNEVVVTFDADFHHMLVATRATTPSVIRIRIEGLKGWQLSKLIVEVVAGANKELATGAVVSVTPGRIRVRALPIGK